MAEKPFRVIIVGAGITGLVLARMLETAGIDFLLLEGHKEVAPVLGASIALQGPALRILDQLGCYEAIRERWNRPTRRMCVLSPQGKPWTAFHANMEHVERRHGYPMIFIDRRHLLQILYDNLESKEKVLTGKRVEEVLTAVNGVLIKLKGGETIAGDILIGADGVHSTVRKEMWRLASKSRPGYFPENEQSRVQVNSRIFFGITKPLPPSESSIAFTTNYGRLYLSSTGTDDAWYWFYFDDNIKDKCDGNNIPRFTKADEKAIVDEFGDDHVTPEYTLRQLHENSVLTGMTAIVEHIYERWHFQRIMTIGDSANIQHPITGYGSVAGLESAATFVNALKVELEKGGHDSPAGRLTDDAVHRMFASVQEPRTERVKFFQKSAKQLAKRLSLKVTLQEYIVPAVARINGQQVQIGRFSTQYVDGVKLKHLPVPQRPRAIPYNDELPEKPVRSKATWFVAKALAATSILCSFYIASLAIRIPDGVPYDSFAGRRLVSTNFIGHEGIDTLLSILGSFFSYSVVEPGKDFLPRLQLIYLLSILAPVCSIWAVEANRKSNRYSAIILPSLFTMAAQLFTLGKAGHVYYLLAMFTASSSHNMLNKHVPVSVCKAILPAICIAYILPTVMMFLPFRNDFLWEQVMAFWQPTPLFFAILTVLLATLIGVYEERARRSRAAAEGKSDFDVKVDKAMDWYNKRDVEALQTTYAFLFVSSALVHVSVILYAWMNTDKSALSVFAYLFGLDASMPSPFVSDWGISDPAQISLILFKNDMLFSSLPLLIFLLYTIWEIRGYGYISSQTAQKVAVAVLAGQVIVGPPATYAGLWYWRETVLAGLSD